MAKHINAKAGSFLKRVFFYYPFYVEVDGKSQMMNLTVYEDSDAKELGQKVLHIISSYDLPNLIQNPNGKKGPTRARALLTQSGVLNRARVYDSCARIARIRLE